MGKLQSKIFYDRESDGKIYVIIFKIITFPRSNNSTSFGFSDVKALITKTHTQGSKVKNILRINKITFPISNNSTSFGFSDVKALITKKHTQGSKVKNIYIY
jgi:hypothetical protein